jgi:PAS domain S-box-containing protein
MVDDARIRRGAKTQNGHDGQEALRSAILTSALDCIISIDGEGRVVEWNPVAERTFGYTRREAIGRLMADLIVPPAMRAAHAAGLRRYAETGTAKMLGRRMEMTAVRSDGTELPVELAITPDRLDGETVFTAYLRDVSERKAAEAELADARDKAVEAARLKSEFLATISHELRTPLNGILGMVALLLETDLDGGQRRYARAIQESGAALHSIIADLLDFSEVEQGKVVLQTREVELHDLLERTTYAFMERAQAKALGLECRIDADVPLRVSGDGVRMGQVLGCLLDNSIKFTASGGVALRAGVASRNGNEVRVRIAVTDSGPGIPENRRGELFAPFVQGDGSSTRRYGGTGLGLSISRELLALMGGEIRIESEPGRGTTAICEIPLVEIGDGVDVRASAELQQRHVLIVDSDPAGQIILRGYLESWRMRGDTAVDTDTAIARLESASGGGEPIDLVLVASKLAAGAGLEVARAVHADARWADLPVVLVTKPGEACPIEEAARAGVSRLLSQPVSRSRLYDTIVDLDGSGSAPVELAPAEGAPAAPMTCLVVEDNVINQQVLIAMLESMGHVVQMADNGVQAVAAFESDSFDCIFMDIQMPEMDGYEATRRIREIEGGLRRTPIIAVTANAMKGDREICMQAGMDDYVPKPVDPVTLAAAISRAAGRGEKAAEPDAAPSPRPAAASATLDSNVLDKLASFQRPGQPDMVSRLIDLFLGQAPTHLASLRAALDDARAEDLARAAHALKGASANLGATKLSAIAADLEIAGRQGDLVPAEQLLANLHEEWLLVERDLGARRVVDDAQPAGSAG